MREEKDKKKIRQKNYQSILNTDFLFSSRSSSMFVHASVFMRQIGGLSGARKKKEEQNHLFRLKDEQQSIGRKHNYYYSIVVNDFISILRYIKTFRTELTIPYTYTYMLQNCYSIKIFIYSIELIVWIEIFCLY